MFFHRTHVIDNIDHDIVRISLAAKDNINQIFKKLRELNPDATIAVQTLYNPYQYWRFSIPDFGVLSDHFDVYVDTYNRFLKSAADEYEIKTVDVNKYFKENNNLSLLNAHCDSLLSLLLGISDTDPHPSAQGHKAIGLCYQTELSGAGFVFKNPIKEDTEAVTTGEQTYISDTESIMHIKETSTSAVTSKELTAPSTPENTDEVYISEIITDESAESGSSSQDNGNSGCSGSLVSFMFILFTMSASTVLTVLFRRKNPEIDIK